VFKLNGLERRNPPNKYSLRRIDKLNAELPERLKLIIRCGGEPYFYNQFAKHNGSTFIIRRVRCVGGVCEICHDPARDDEILEPHEDPERSAGGRVSLEQSVMCHRRCHPISKPQLEWIKGE